MSRGLFLDLDGTLADSLGVLKQVYRDFLDRHGSVGTEAEFEEMNGPPIARVVAMLRERHGLPGTIDNLLKTYLAMLADAHAASLPATGARQLLDKACAGDWRVAVVTSATRQSAVDWLARHGLAAKVSVVVGGDDVVRGKPAPDPYLLAIERTGADVARSIAVEDSRAGAAAATSAGLQTYVLAPEPNRADWPAGARFLNSLADALDLVSC